MNKLKRGEPLSAIHDLIAQISDSRLRERLAAEWATASQEKKFGLVFEDHLPELLPLYDAKPRRGDLVCRRHGPLKEVWQVRALRDGMATCIKPQDDTHPAESSPSASAPVNFAVDELLVVRQFGEPIFPALVPMDAVANGSADAPWHTLIEADNYHALQLLDYLYAGKVDCIYIDPPYNTGARDWKYNNDYVDGNDGWRHSKWLAFMEKRLKIAKRLLNHNGVLAIAIDNNELAHLACLIETGGEFDSYDLTIVTVVHNPRGNITANFAKINEYVIFLTPKSQQILARTLVDSDNPRKLRRWGHFSLRTERRSMFYPIYIRDGVVTRIGEQPSDDFHPVSRNVDAGEGVIEVWPIDQNGVERRWNYAHSEISSHIDRIVALPKDGGIDLFLVSELSPPKTVWAAPELDAGGVYGSSFVESVVGTKFPYPKSIYGTLRAIEPILLKRPNALVVDFFAGSGTTLNAVNLLNTADGGQRRCILVTNNEVSADEAESLRGRSLQPGDAEWEALGICRSVTWPRSKFTIRGQRDDGTALSGDFLTGKTVDKEKARSFTQVGFVDPATLNTPAKKKQVVALINGLPQTLVKDTCPFIVSEDHKASILFDMDAADGWLEALEEQEHVTDFYIVTPTKKVFDGLKAQVVELLGPMLVSEDEKRPMSAGFAANLAYFKLDFLDKNRVALKRAFREILPLLWLKAGAVGARPELSARAAEPVVFAPEGSNFAVLLDEGRMAKLLQSLSSRKGLSHVFIVTDADESFKAMATEVVDTLGKKNPCLQVVQLYRDYLVNFMINKRQDSSTVAAPGTQG